MRKQPEPRITIEQTPKTHETPDEGSKFVDFSKVDKSRIIIDKNSDIIWIYFSNLEKPIKFTEYKDNSTWLAYQITENNEILIWYYRDGKLYRWTRIKITAKLKRRIIIKDRDTLEEHTIPALLIDYNWSRQIYSVLTDLYKDLDRTERHWNQHNPREEPRNIQ